MPTMTRGTGQWSGVVMIIRPSNAELVACARDGVEPFCRILSARIVQLNGSRAIAETTPYETVRHLFCSDDGDHIFCEAEYFYGHLELYQRTAGNPNLKEWVEHSYTDEQLRQEAT